MNENKKRYIGATAIILAAIMWGFDGVVLTPRLFSLNVGFVVFMLHLVPFVLMNTFLFKEYKKIKTFTKTDLATLLALSFFGGALGTLAIVKALFLVHFQHLSVVVLLQKLQPIFAIILAAIFLKEKIEKNFVLWAVIAIGASYTLTFGFHLPHAIEDADLIQASIWAVIAAFSFGSATVFGKKALNKFPYYTTNFYRFGFTAIIMFIYVLLTGAIGEFQNITTDHLMYFLIIAVTTGSGAIFLFYFGLNKVKAMVSTICELFFPISAILFDYLINDHKLSLVQWISAIIMILAVVEISYKRKKIR
ncbi:MAG: DMT family transporter [Candidatus Cloacimonetes bacterium]|nr:DMT family transporter [Candidatus Cloacimonadota bacterium]MCF7813411.1 DMT family transporter [Candidatus Cloacimonadota bacterium]MCF7867704.1 DMT family transporter [Candidatus Cloacimonadota bacterium]MCF7883210.1 DMT family transporter [Candidatus Cloacimonadota bacterium]